MSKPPADGAEGEDEEKEAEPDEEPPEIPPLPVVLVATHAGAVLNPNLTVSLRGAAAVHPMLKPTMLLV